jgi:hypothetical protein
MGPEEVFGVGLELRAVRPHRRRPPETASEVGSSWGAKYGLRKAVNRLTGPVKTPKNAHNTGFLQSAIGSGNGRCVAFWWRRRGSGGSGSPFVSRHNPLVNSVDGAWRAEIGRTIAASGGDY